MRNSLFFLPFLLFLNSAFAATTILYSNKPLEMDPTTQVVTYTDSDTPGFTYTRVFSTQNERCNFYYAVGHSINLSKFQHKFAIYWINNAYIDRLSVQIVNQCQYMRRITPLFFNSENDISAPPNSNVTTPASDSNSSAASSANSVDSVQQANTSFDNLFGNYGPMGPMLPVAPFSDTAPDFQNFRFDFDDVFGVRQ
jgi:hypothetical protein